MKVEPSNMKYNKLDSITNDWCEFKILVPN